MLCARIFLVAAVALTPLSTPAAEDRYDALGAVISPLMSVFAKDSASGNRALSLTLRIEQMTDLPDGLRDARAEISVEYPYKLRLHGPVLGESVTIVRNGDVVWVHPGGVAKSLLKGTGGKELPKGDKKYELTDFYLPVPEKQLVFLPVLFTVKDVGSERLDGRQCRVMDVQLMPQIARSLDVQGWVGRLWIDPENKPVRVTIAKEGFHVVLRVEEIRYAQELPSSTWEPTPEEAGDILVLEPKDYSRFLRAIAGEKKKPKKESGKQESTKGS